jgi:hypothetical protein
METISPLALEFTHMDLTAEQPRDTSQQFSPPHPPVNSDSDGQSEVASDFYGDGQMDFDSFFHSIPNFDNLDFTFDYPSEVSIF